mmetsp:Transcript_37338/g.81576  ORF Transcript_37338/g.81576 Transcript_37338/m.81576 type:complete len:305 (-) Transcript_37338:443-1357(-)
MLAHVRMHGVRPPVPRRLPVGLVRRGQGRSRNVLIHVSQLHQLVLDVAGLGHPVVVRHGSRRPQEHVAQPGLADVAASVVVGEPLHDRRRKLRLPVQEHPAEGHEYIIKNDNQLLPPILSVPLVDLPALQGPGVAGLAAVDVHDALPVHGNSAGDGVVLVLRREALPGHHHHPVGIERARLMDLRPPNHHPVHRPPDHPHEEVRILLLRRAAPAVPLGIGHGPPDHDVSLLRLRNKPAEPCVVLRTTFLVHVIRGCKHRIGGVHTHAPLEARAGDLPQPPLHPILHHDVLRRLCDMQKPAVLDP